MKKTAYRTFDLLDNKIECFLNLRGKLQGELRVIDKDGKCFRKENYENGQCHGIVEVYAKRGIIIKKSYWKFGKKFGQDREFGRGFIGNSLNFSSAEGIVKLLS